MSDEKNDKSYDVPLADHEYDGIQELNNPAPFWWQLFFYLSIAFGIGYYAYYELGSGPTTDDRITALMNEVDVAKSAHKTEGPDENALLALVNDPTALKEGNEVYQAKCTACHASDGGGVVGPNLADEYWIHGKGSVLDLHKVLTEGVAEKGMPPWGPILTEKEMNALVAFVKSLQGKKPAVPKAPQGNKV